MRTELLPAIEALRAEVAAFEAKAEQTKEMANRMCELAGVEPAYPNQAPAAAPVKVAIKENQFLGRQLGTAAREFLEARASAGMRAASPREIFEGLRRGGFTFDTRSDENSITSVRSALRRQPDLFCKLANGEYALVASVSVSAGVPGADAGKSTADLKPRARPRVKKSGRRSSKSVLAKRQKQVENQGLSSFIVKFLEGGGAHELDAIKQAAIREGSLGIDAGTPLRRLQGILLSLLKRNVVRSLGNSKWATAKSDSGPTGGASVHSLNRVA